ncbi:MAG: general secretion pathway protein GspI [Deltaproteobacteria bacterium]|nr:general secretion pathway protein GspI [Deltaproteobacteria bacterium]
MVALAILGLGLTAILSAQAGLYGANVQARNLTLATSAARCKMDELEAELLGKGYPETDQAEDGPCCSGDSPAGMSCHWNIERVELPNPPASQVGDGGLTGGGGDAGVGGGLAGGGMGGLGALGALAGAAGNPGALADGGISALTSTLAQPTGPSGQTGVAGIAGLAMNIVYPQLKPLLEASIRRVTLDVMWNEGPIARKLTIVQFVTNPQKGLPPIIPGMGSAQPGMPGMPGMPGAPGGGITPLQPPGGGMSSPIGAPR